MRGRPRETRDLVPIAREIARGVAQARIAADRGCSRTVISRRVRTMREILTRHHGDASWMGEEKTNVEVAVGFLAVAEAEESPEA